MKLESSQFDDAGAAGHFVAEFDAGEVVVAGEQVVPEHPVGEGGQLQRAAHDGTVGDKRDISPGLFRGAGGVGVAGFEVDVPGGAVYVKGADLLAGGAQPRPGGPDHDLVGDHIAGSGDGGDGPQAESHVVNSVGAKLHVEIGGQLS